MQKVTRPSTAHLQSTQPTERILPLSYLHGLGHRGWQGAAGVGPSWAQFRKALRDAADTCWHLGAVPLSLSQSPISRAVPTGCSSQLGSPPGSASSCITGREGASGAKQRSELQGRGWEAEQREGPPLRSMELRVPQTGRVASSVRLSSWQEFKENQRIPGRDRGTPTPDCPAVGCKVKDPGGRNTAQLGKSLQ